MCSLSACSGGPQNKPDAVPVVDMKNKDLQLNQRMQALERGRKESIDDPAQRPAFRNGLKDLMWKGAAPYQLRIRALELLLEDADPALQADTRNLLRLRLPTETSWQVVTEICKSIEKRATDPAWRELTASLVRSYARKVPVPPDPDRPERSALMALYPGQNLESMVFAVYVNPEAAGAPKKPDDAAEKSRQAAWDLLGRLDPTGSRRTAMIAADTTGAPALDVLRRSARELGVVPVTGSELAWLTSVMNDKDERNAAWWSATSRVVQGLNSDQRQGLQLRHLEPLRWASVHRPQWLSATRQGLVGELSSRLQSRRTHFKTEGVFGGERGKELLSDWEPTLAFGDVLAILVIDEAVREPGVVQQLAGQIDADRNDTTTEYGGVLWSRDQITPPAAVAGGRRESADASSHFYVRGFQPRPTQRTNDRTFIAPEEMFSSSGRALAHYHFHVQTDNNTEFAGPGKGDMDYADTHGRSCLVLTSVRAGVVDIDYYQRGGATIDLGEVNLPAAAAR